MREAVLILEEHAAMHLLHSLSNEQRRLTTAVLCLGEMVLRPYVLKYRHDLNSRMVELLQVALHEQ